MGFLLRQDYATLTGCRNSVEVTTTRHPFPVKFVLLFLLTHRKVSP